MYPYIWQFLRWRSISIFRGLIFLCSDTTVLEGAFFLDLDPHSVEDSAHPSHDFRRRLRRNHRLVYRASMDAQGIQARIDFFWDFDFLWDWNIESGWVCAHYDGPKQKRNLNKPLLSQTP